MSETANGRLPVCTKTCVVGCTHARFHSCAFARLRAYASLLDLRPVEADDVGIRPRNELTEQGSERSAA